MAFYVKEIRTCAQCGGNGFTYHPRWAEFNVAFKKAGFTRWSNEADEWANNWWKKQGFPSADDAPDEEVACLECGGTGTVRHLVELTEALKALGIGE